MCYRFGYEFYQGLVELERYFLSTGSGYSPRGSYDRNRGGNRYDNKRFDDRRSYGSGGNNRSYGGYQVICFFSLAVSAFNPFPVRAFFFFLQIGVFEM